MTTIRCPSCGHQHAAPADERDRRTIEAQQEELHRLRGENERLRREYEEEVDEFNAGCDARKAGLNIHEEENDALFRKGPTLAAALDVALEQMERGVA